MTISLRLQQKSILGSEKHPICWWHEPVPSLDWGCLQDVGVTYWTMGRLAVHRASERQHPVRKSRPSDGGEEKLNQNCMSDFQFQRCCGKSHRWLERGSQNRFGGMMMALPSTLGHHHQGFNGLPDLSVSKPSCSGHVNNSHFCTQFMDACPMKLGT